jgi:nucleoside-diphosphate-sugar epimerase
MDGTALQASSINQCRNLSLSPEAPDLSGSHLAEAFVRNHYTVRVIDNLSTGKLANLARVRDSIDFRNVDVRDLASLIPALEGASIILHHAGISSVIRSFEDQAATHEVNVTGTQNLLEAAAAVGAKKVINASSSSVYGDTGAELQTEEAFPAPLSPYGFSKWLGEIYSLQFAQITQVKTISLRYFILTYLVRVRTSTATQLL